MRMNITSRQLKAFVLTARHQSFSRAAEELHLTQPAVSTQVRKLEEHAGLALFEQLGKKIHLTPAGTQMLHSAREIIQKFKEAEEAMAQFKGVSGGQLNVSVMKPPSDFSVKATLARRCWRTSSIPGSAVSWSTVATSRPIVVSADLSSSEPERFSSD